MWVGMCVCVCVMMMCEGCGWDSVSVWMSNEDVVEQSLSTGGNCSEMF